MKTMRSVVRTLGWLAMVSAMLVTGPAAAQNTYPNKPLNILIPFAAGGTLDPVTRSLGEAYAKAYGQPWIIENLGGAGGTIAATRAARAPADGYHLFMASTGQVSAAPFVRPSLSYDPHKDLVPIVHVADTTAVLYTTANSPYRTVADVVKAAKEAPGKISFAHAGIGSVSHLGMALLEQQTGARFVPIPYKGAAIADLAAGTVPLLFTYVSSAQSMVDAGRVRPLAVASEQRLTSLPGVPTFAQAGVSGVVAKLWIGLMAPAGTPQTYVDTLAHQVNEALRQPAIRERLAPRGLEVVGGTTQQFSDMIIRDTARWRELSKAVKLSVQ